MTSDLTSIAHTTEASPGSEIVGGIPENEVVMLVAKYLCGKALSYAGTERAVYFSVDDGEHWQSLRLNLPATSIRDLVVHQDDIVVGTHGRSFWVLDDVTPLRQTNSQVGAANGFLFKPQVAYRVRRSLNTDTPIPPEEPMGQNPLMERPETTTSNPMSVR